MEASEPSEAEKVLTNQQQYVSDDDSMSADESSS